MKLPRQANKPSRCAHACFFWHFSLWLTGCGYPLGNDHISHQTGKGKSSTQKCLVVVVVVCSTPSGEAAEMSLGSGVDFFCDFAPTWNPLIFLGGGAGGEFVHGEFHSLKLTVCT